MWCIAALLGAAACAAAQPLPSPPPPVATNITSASRPEDFPFRSGELGSSRATCAWGPLTAGGSLNAVAVFGSSGGTRSFNLALPRGYKTGGPRTMLIAFHGGICFAYGDAICASFMAMPLLT